MFGIIDIRNIYLLNPQNHGIFIKYHFGVLNHMKSFPIDTFDTSSGGYSVVEITKSFSDFQPI